MELIKSYQFETYNSQLYLANLAEAGLGIDLLVVDQNTARFAPLGVPCIELAAGEENKTLKQLERVLAAAIKHQLTRKSCIAALGGGVLCDLTGLAASVYMRGCSLMLLPSTLLAMVDAGLGGKTAVDFQEYKNIVGSFYPATQVRLLPELLSYQNERDYRSGLAEVLKHALLGGGELYRLVEEESTALLARDPALLRQLLPLATAVKGDIVMRDLHENGERAHLNLGHTFAHALETLSNFSITHGEAVAWGLVQAAELAAKCRLCVSDYPQRVRALVDSYAFPLDYSFSSKALLEVMNYDKKRHCHGTLRLVLQGNVGETFIQEFLMDELSLLL